MNLTTDQIATVHRRVGTWRSWREVDTFAARWLCFAPIMVRIGVGEGNPQNGGMALVHGQTWHGTAMRMLGRATGARPVAMVTEASGLRAAGRLFDADLISAVELTFPRVKWRVCDDVAEWVDCAAYAYSKGVLVGVVAAMVRGM